MALLGGGALGLLAGSVLEPEFSLTESPFSGDICMNKIVSRLMHCHVCIIHHVTYMTFVEGGTEGLGAGGVVALYGVGLGGAGTASISESHF